MRVSVSGASGFIGKYVLNALVNENVEIFALTRDPEKLKNFPQTINIIKFDKDVVDGNTFEKIGSPDVLIHLAWDGLPNYKSLHHFEVELPKQYHFLKSVIDSGLKSLFVTGTCFEYGMQSGPLSESSITAPTNPYGYAKDTLRKNLEFLKKKTNFNLTWARLFYLYGEGQAENSLYSQMKKAIERKDKVFNMSYGEQLRDYLPVEVVAELIVKIALLEKDLNCINVCSGHPISVRHLVEGWVQDNGWNIDLNLGHYPYPDYEPMAFWGVNQSFSYE